MTGVGSQSFTLGLNWWQKLQNYCR